MRGASSIILGVWFSALACATVQSRASAGANDRQPVEIRNYADGELTLYAKDNSGPIREIGVVAVGGRFMLLRSADGAVPTVTAVRALEANNVIRVQCSKPMTTAAGTFIDCRADKRTR